MKSILPLAIALIGIVTPGAALAGANKTWVAGNGVDSGTCALTAPCKSFQYAHDQTSAGGEIDVKDSGGYGVLTITKPITIVAEGVAATISVPSNGTGITVSAGYYDKVVIRGVTIDGHGVGTNGIVTNSPTLIEKSAIRNLPYGVIVNSSTSYASVKDSSITGCSNAVYPAGIVYLSGNQIAMNTYGVSLTAGGTAYSFGDNVFFANTRGNYAGGNPLSLSKQ